MFTIVEGISMGKGLQMNIEKAKGLVAPVYIGLNEFVIGVFKVPGFYVGEWVFAKNSDIQVLVFPAIGYLIR